MIWIWWNAWHFFCWQTIALHCSVLHQCMASSCLPVSADSCGVTTIYLLRWCAACWSWVVLDYFLVRCLFLCSEDVKLCTSLCCFALPEYWHMFLYFRIKEFIFLSWVSKVEQNCLESTDRSAIKLFGVRGVHAWAYGISKPCMVPKLDLLYLCCHCIRRKLLISAFWLQDASWGCRKRNAGLSILKDPF